MSMSLKDLAGIGPLLLCALFALIILAIRKVRSTRASFADRARCDKEGKREAAMARAQTQEREPGVWHPVEFDYPAIEPFEGDIMTLKPIPYRPFRWGEYHVTMGIRSMNWNEWTEIDKTFFDYHKVVKHRLQIRGDRAVIVNPAQPGIVGSAHAAARELVHELAEYLSRRYPDLYRVVRKEKGEKGEGGWYGEGPIKTITIEPLDQTYDLDEMEPLKVASLLAQEDWALMLEGSDGRYYLQAGAIAKPGFWRLQDKIGMPLEEIHLSGNVPQYQNKLHVSMARFFRRLPVDKPVTRNNYFFQVVTWPQSSAAQNNPAATIDPTELAWSMTMHGKEDKTDFERAVMMRNVGAEDAKTGPLDLATVYLRTERQTLRRLPRTGAIVFSIRVYQTCVVDLAKEPGVPGRLASAIRGWQEDVAQYKDLFAYKDILQYLDECHAEQLKQGVIRADDPQTSDFPF
ncbi:uncharacterized protein LAESUDRAFT_640177 [Laetiporus sulphureus 93-53]|uniref:DUF3445 domain-containing protein n=1 Tax=Laetiporus sulphureus 93-53 TaxID=1314785 RepID=A0A165I6A1_9APHY|nr:uncharacterized protein LAESUDRAFT_640177 [Laetiporus sulphureus 93-53]KZT12648.1 hypothetical protein LAESUDRAFT_640177 [Laetiporus sulphureus 93-53]